MKNILKTVTIATLAAALFASPMLANENVSVSAAAKTAAETECLKSLGFETPRDFKVVGGDRRVAGISVGSGSKIVFANDLLANEQIMEIAEACRYDKLVTN